MTYPELYTDERVILQAQNVKVKSVVFEVVLTTRRLVLIDTKRSSIPPQEINLATLKDVESGENAIRDPTITVSIITISGNTRQMVLTFSKTSGGERKRECDEWVRALKQNITSTVYHPVTQAPPEKEQEPEPVVQIPISAPHEIDISGTPPPKKRIEPARPVKKIIEAAPVIPSPIETTSLPTGMFCNRCGSRIPVDSVFCNRCGTPVVQEPDLANLPEGGEGSTAGQPAPAAPYVQVPAISAAPEKKDRPIEEVIHSIEPLIEDSVPRTAPAPLVPPKQAYYASPIEGGAEPGGQLPEEPAPAAPDASALPGGVQWPVLSQTGASDTAAPPAVPAAPPVSAPLPPLPQKKSPLIYIVAGALVLLAVIAGAYVFMQGHAETPGATTPTPEVTVPPTTLPKTTVATPRPTTAPLQVTTPSYVIPAGGVWVKVSYPNKFSGSVGTLEWAKQVEDTGDKFYQVSTSSGTVAVSLQKTDGTSAKLAVDVYKDGTLIHHAETSTPLGIVEFHVPLAAENTTADSTGK